MAFAQSLGKIGENRRKSTETLETQCQNLKKNAREKKMRAENIRVHFRFRSRAKIFKTRFSKQF